MTYHDGYSITLSQSHVLTAPQQVTTLAHAAKQLHERGWIEIHSDTNKYDKALKKYVRRIAYTLTGAGAEAAKEIAG